MQYVKTCVNNQVMKTDHQAKAGLPHPLENTTRKWAHVTIDLVINLPESKEFTTIAVFIDKLTEMVHPTPCKKELNAI